MTGKWWSAGSQKEVAEGLDEQLDFADMMFQTLSLQR